LGAGLFAITGFETFHGLKLQGDQLAGCVFEKIAVGFIKAPLPAIKGLGLLQVILQRIA